MDSSDWRQCVSALDSYEVSYRLPEWSELKRAYRDYKDIRFEDEDNIKPSEVYEYRKLKEAHNLEWEKVQHYNRRIRDTAHIIDILLYKLTQVNRDLNKYIEKKYVPYYYGSTVESILLMTECTKAKIIDKAMPYFNILNKNILQKMARNIGCHLTGKEQRNTLVRTLMLNKKNY